VRYVMFSEAWMVKRESGDLPPIRRGRMRPSEEPDRIEVITYQGEEFKGGRISAHQQIFRVNRRGKLGPIEIDDDPKTKVTGDLAGILRPRDKV
jgi:hypothetical protein